MNGRASRGRQTGWRKLRRWIGCLPANGAGIFALLCAPLRIMATGPPYVTDDPEPTEYRQWEIYAASQHLRDTEGWTGTAPHLDVNYGIARNTQLSVVLPLAFAKSKGQTFRYGIGDIEAGIKYRFIQETRSRPQVGIFPLITVPTGDHGRGLGSGVTDVFLPIWLQKSWGSWTTYGGGGYCRNPGTGNRDFWYYGWLLERDVTKRLTVGGELFGATADTAGGRASAGVNLGLIYHVDEGHHVLFSAGDDLSGTGRGLLYIGYLWLFGPHRAVDSSVSSTR